MGIGDWGLGIGVWKCSQKQQTIKDNSNNTNNFLDLSNYIIPIKQSENIIEKEKEKEQVKKEEKKEEIEEEKKEEKEEIPKKEEIKEEKRVSDKIDRSNFTEEELNDLDGIDYLNSLKVLEYKLKILEAQIAKIDGRKRKRKRKRQHRETKK